ncbi:hypothetical protein GCM10027084_23470 [Pseudoxanthomonas sangjuensis]|uniref:DUF1801 domain-containing protein n=1 Tax=Pseudoxanthomonas sangjuensis TaxID=1503750 RepID=UPI001390839C|nr:DUF1801 domain-containing protein [Pseudoxanthomonas sangjuensis]KAF1713605.1 hypothetical protein CSC71_06930 [Pseudoxanthomonas sangjuensis]
MTTGTSGSSKPRKSATKSVRKTAKKAEPAASPADWRVETLARMRALIVEAVPDAVEERKWMKPSNPLGVPVWSRDGIICTGETYRQYVKLTFAKGASLPDPAQLFNASLEGGTRRAIDIHEGGKIDARAFKALVKAAAALNGSSAKKKAKPAAEKRSR